jgi:hypothetical protein
MTSKAYVPQTSEPEPDHQRSAIKQGIIQRFCIAAMKERSLTFSLSQVRPNRVMMVTAFGTMVRRLVLKVLKPRCLRVKLR